MTNVDFQPLGSARSVPALADPAAAALETMARLRVLERLLQRALVPEITADERRSLLARYNQQRQEIFDRIDGTKVRMLPTPLQLQELVAGPLTLESADATLANAAGSVRRMMEMLVIC